MLKKTIFVVAISLGLLLPSPIYASYLYFSPTDINSNSDSNFDVQVRLNTLKDSINAATVNINYPADLLSVSGINYDASALGLSVESSSNNGLIKITRGSFKTVNGDVNIGTITFHPQKSGTGKLTFGSGTKVPRLYDFADSLDSSQNGTENITINPSASPTSNPSTDTNPCKVRENTIKQNSKKILDSGGTIFNSIDRVTQLIQKYPQNPAAGSPDFQFKMANVQLQKTLTQQNLTAAQNDLNSYSCDKPNAKTQLAQFRKDIASAKQSLKNYRQAVKDLIGLLLGK